MILLYSSPDYYDKNLIKGLKKNLPDVKKITVQNILFSMLMTNTTFSNKTEWEIFLTQENNSVYLAPIKDLDNLSRQVPVPKTNYDIGIKQIKAYYGQLIQEYADILVNLGKSIDKNIKHNDINPIATLLMGNELEEKVLNKYPAIHLLYKILQKQLEDCQFVIIPGTNRSVASPLLGSRKIISKLLNGIELKAIDVDTKAMTHEIGLENNFLDSLSILLISRIAQERKIKILAFCHGAQVLHIGLGGFINYSYRRYNPKLWNETQLELSYNHPLRRVLQLENPNASYYNTIFMEYNDYFAKKEGYSTIKRELSSIVPTHKKQNIIEYFEYLGIFYASQIHVEHDPSNHKKIYDFIKKEIGIYNKKHYMRDHDHPLRAITTIQDEPEDIESMTSLDEKKPPKLLINHSDKEEFSHDTLEFSMARFINPKDLIQERLEEDIPSGSQSVL